MENTQHFQNHLNHRVNHFEPQLVSFGSLSTDLWRHVAVAPEAGCCMSQGQAVAMHRLQHQGLHAVTTGSPWWSCQGQLW